MNKIALQRLSLAVAAIILATGLILPANAQISRSTVLPAPGVSTAPIPSELGRLRQEVADNDGRISALQIGVQRAARQYTQCLGGLTFQCSAPNVSTNAQGGSQDCGTYQCNPSTGLCHEPYTCKSSTTDCMPDTPCDVVDGTCHAPRQ